MRIAILGWGSLIWNPRDLRISDAGWQQGGPQLPIELSRLSTKRRHLTYVIDERHERRVPTQYAFSRYGDLEDAVADLACREDCPAHSIGYIESADHGRHRSRTQLCWDVQAWARSKHIDAAIWTDLPPKLPDGVGFSSLLAIFKKLLAELPPEIAEQAKEYARRAPDEVDTDLRRQLNAENLLAPAEPSPPH